MKKYLRTTLFSLCAVAGIAMASTASAQEGDLLARIKAKKEIVIATEARYAPFEFIENGKIVGYDSDLLAYVLKSLPGVHVKELDLPFQGLLPGLDAKAFDMVVAAITVNKDRASHFAFTAPIALSVTSILVRAQENAVNAPTDLNGKTVGSQTGSVQLQALLDLDKQLKAAGGSGFKAVKQYVSFDEAYADLGAGRLDAVAQSLANIGPLLKSRPGVFKLVSGTLGEKAYFSWAARKDADSASLVKLFNDAITRANQDGTMKQLQMKWFGTTMDVPASALP